MATRRSPAARFERVAPNHDLDDVQFTRSEVSPTLSAKAAADAGAFLGRLWTHFGPATSRDHGFSYHLRDRSTEIRFTARASASGPGYAGTDEAADLRPVLEDLERMLVKTKPADCEIAYTMEIDYGGAQRVIGCKRGRSFARVHDTRTSPTTARTHADCVTIAKEHEGGYGAIAGWQLCLDRVLPEPPDEVTYRGRLYDNCVGFTIERAAAVMLYCHGDSSPKGIPIDAIPFKRRTAIAGLWLEAFAAWTQRKRSRGAVTAKARSRSTRGSPRSR